MMTVIKKSQQNYLSEVNSSTFETCRSRNSSVGSEDKYEFCFNKYRQFGKYCGGGGGGGGGVGGSGSSGSSSSSNLFVFSFTISEVTYLLTLSCHLHHLQYIYSFFYLVQPFTPNYISVCLGFFYLVFVHAFQHFRINYFFVHI